MTRKTNNQILTEIQIKTAKIEQHLDDINGSIQETKAKQDKLDCEIHKIKNTQTRNTAFIGVGIAILNIMIMAVMHYY